MLRRCRGLSGRRRSEVLDDVPHAQNIERQRRAVGRAVIALCDIAHAVVPGFKPQRPGGSGDRPGKLLLALTRRIDENSRVPL